MTEKEVFFEKEKTSFSSLESVEILRATFYNRTRIYKEGKIYEAQTERYTAIKR